MNDFREIKLKRGGLDQSYLPLTGILNLFPKDSFGGPRKSERGAELVLEVDGLAKEVRTDVPADAKTGRPRPMFRDRGWVSKFVRKHSLKDGHTVGIVC